MSENEVRLNYAADQIIFNWANGRSELRVDGGPAGGQHRKGVGGIPPKKWLTIKQVVLLDRMTIYVDDEERATWEADFSTVNQPIRIFPYHDMVSVKQVLVRQLK